MTGTGRHDIGKLRTRWAKSDVAREAVALYAKPVRHLGTVSPPSNLGGGWVGGGAPMHGAITIEHI